MAELRSEVASLTARHGLDDEATSRLLALLDALAAEADPPTTVREPRAALEQHLADSLSGLAVRQVREAGRIADVGAGAGFPGLPLAVALPGAAVDLLESTRRKATVIERLASAGRVGNARVIAERAEAWSAGPGRCAYEVVTARAVARLAVLVEYAAPLLRLEGVLVAWKGHRDEGEERAGAAAAARLGLAPDEVVSVRPFAGARARHLHVMVKREPTPARYPRRPGMAVKRPLA